MKLGVLQAGRLSPPLDAFGDYTDMFRDLFRRVAPEIEVHRYEVTLGEHPDDPRDCDLWLISGSAHGVHDDLDWLPRLEDFVSRLHTDRHRTIGVCFGHQLIAKVCGGEVTRARGGWCAGAISYSGMQGEKARLIASHQDQVVRMPDGAALILRAESCPIAGFTIGRHMITVQAHPEFKTDFARALYAFRREKLGEQGYRHAMDSLAHATSELNMTRQLLDFVHG